MRRYMVQTEKYFAWRASVAVLALRINMREARCETPGMRIPLLGGYRSSKISRSLEGIFALFSCLRKYKRLASFLLILAT